MTQNFSNSKKEYCEIYRQFEMGDIDADAFDMHRQTCPTCQKLEAQDQRLLNLVQNLKQSVEAPGLWERIESELIEEKAAGRRPKLLQFSRRTAVILRVAAVVIVAVGLGVRFWPRSDASNLLAPSALARVERLEKSYAEAIADLEESVAPKMTSMDIELALLYRDRLETIDAQIVRCQDALNINPGNVHIRQYMMAALQDKKNTLIEIQKS